MLYKKLPHSSHVHTLPRNIWAFQWCRNTPPMGQDSICTSLTHNTPSHPQTSSWVLCAAPPFKPVLPFSPAGGFTFIWCQHRTVSCISWRMLRALFAIAQDFYRCLPTDPPAVLGILFTMTIDATQSLQTWLLDNTALHSSLGCCSTIPFFCSWLAAPEHLHSTAHLRIMEHLHTTEHTSSQGPPGREMSPST